MYCVKHTGVAYVEYNTCCEAAVVAASAAAIDSWGTTTMNLHEM